MAITQALSKKLVTYNLDIILIFILSQVNFSQGKREVADIRGIFDNLLDSITGGIYDLGNTLVQRKIFFNCKNTYKNNQIPIL